MSPWLCTWGHRWRIEITWHIAIDTSFVLISCPSCLSHQERLLTYILSHNSYCPISKYNHFDMISLRVTILYGWWSDWSLEVLLDLPPKWCQDQDMKSITNSRLCLSWILKVWQRDMIQWPLLFTIGNSLEWINLRGTLIKGRLVQVIMLWKNTRG